MARVNVETRALAEGRFFNFMNKLELSRAEAIGVLVLFWHDSQERGVWKGPRDTILKFLPFDVSYNATVFEVLVDQDYVTESADGEFVIRGNQKHIEALEQRLEAAKKGGEASWKKRSNKSNTIEVPVNQIEAGGEPNAMQFNAVQFNSIQSNSEKALCPERALSVLQDLADPLSDEYLRKVKPEVQTSWLSLYGDASWVKREIGKAVVWCKANPGRAPKSQFSRFFTNWLASGWERHRKTIATQPARKPIEEILGDA